MSSFESLATGAARALGPVAVRMLADRIGAGWPDDAVVSGVGGRFAETVRPILRAVAEEKVPVTEAAAFLRGLSAGYTEHASTISVETVWTGPSSHAVPVRSMAQALTQLVSEATSELVLMTYSAKPHKPVTEALTAAVERGVVVDVVVETLQGAGSALSGAEPAMAFADISEVRLWHWPVRARSEPSSKMHAKVAVADRRVLLVSSANLTQSGVAKNIEAGTLVRGGTAPVRAAEHIADLRATGVLDRLTIGG